MMRPEGESIVVKFREIVSNLRKVYIGLDYKQLQQVVEDYERSEICVTSCKYLFRWVFF